MKKILFLLLITFLGLNVNAQVMKVYKDGRVVTEYKASEVDSLVFEPEPPVVFVQKIVLDTPYLTLGVGASLKISASVSPADASNPSLRWSSGNEAVARVVDGTVTGVSEGTTEILCEALDGSGTKAVCYVSVVSQNPEVRFAFYETVPGYSVNALKFYVNANQPATDNRVYLYNNEGDAKCLGALSWPDEDVTHFLSHTSNPATRTEFQKVAPSAGGALTMKVNYSLCSTDGSGEVIRITGATAQLPAQFTVWERGHRYTYMFKISEVAGPTEVIDMYPILFDGVFVEALGGGGTTR